MEVYVFRQKRGYLDKAIEYYKADFELGLRNFFTGINVAHLLFLKHDKESLNLMKTIIEVVSFSIYCIPDDEKDFWAYATRIHY